MSEQNRVPFKAEYDPALEQLKLSGDLDADPQTEAVLDDVFAEMGKKGVAQLLILTEGMHLSYEGADLWLAKVAACEALRDAEIFYQGGELATVLKFDDEYAHARSKYFGKP